VARYKPNSLFRSGENLYLNVSIGTNGGPYDYGDFSHGYFSAANYLVDALRQGDRPDLFVDTCIYPIVSNYRHAIELAIKHCVIVASQMLGRRDNLPTNHDLNASWKQLRDLEAESNSSWMPDEDRDFLSDVIRDFSVTDPIGVVFRYPEDKKRNLQIDEFEFLNLQVLYDAMVHCRSILEALDAKLGQMAEYASASSRSTPYPTG
ncbi:MAG: hypothetical protein WAO00_13915, partial [Chthoniobacterales bacterium]